MSFKLRLLPHASLIDSIGTTDPNRADHHGTVNAWTVEFSGSKMSTGLRVRRGDKDGSAQMR